MALAGADGVLRGALWIRDRRAARVPGDRGSPSRSCRCSRSRANAPGLLRDQLAVDELDALFLRTLKESARGAERVRAAAPLMSAR
jgi:hypothetical protein